MCGSESLKSKAFGPLISTIILTCKESNQRLQCPRSSSRADLPCRWQRTGVGSLLAAARIVEVE